MPEVTPSQGMREGATLTFNAINQQFNHLLGRVLTVVDAAFADPIQRKAVKDLVKAEFREQTNLAYNLCFSAEDGTKVLDSGGPAPERF